MFWHEIFRLGESYNDFEESTKTYSGKYVFYEV